MTRFGRAIGVLGAAVLGVVVGVLGTVAHRGHQPWGLVAALALVVSVGVLARAWRGWSAWAGYVAGLLVVVQVLARTGPGGDVLIPAGAAIGWVWMIGSAGLALLVAAVPRRVFDRTPLPPRAVPAEQ
ncbi:DUF6113 family protein [Cellulomonas citrea]|uniref:DUF6113 family protein n=1 Tax=Cellulomonas citrea TaxID=1909423 RepID=UPI00135B14C8|nr:hypothetical protein [Cellulomonas citrea]